ncbi:MAG TPA: redoxin domain-containing protein [Planctomycetaceae bacterium]|jgi:peroxiredoxin|nr:redoxin domain-containing protein [Planctomycetaceae bacterium]
MRKIVLVIPISAALIAGLVWYRLHRAPTTAAPVAIASARRAPQFQLYDEQSQIVRLERYLGRHKLLIVFFDGTKGPDGSDLLNQLREGDQFLPIHETGAVVLAIGALRPSELRPPPNERGERTIRDRPFPFPLLADFDGLVHRQYGAVDDTSGKTREAVFVIDRTGIIRHVHLGPDDLGTPGDWARELRQVK